jgi:hypothetical protein
MTFARNLGTSAHPDGRFAASATGAMTHRLADGAETVGQRSH